MRLLPRLTGSFASCCAKVLDAEPQIWQYGLAFRDSWRHGRKTPSGPRGSSGIRTMLVEMSLEGIFVELCSGTGAKPLVKADNFMQPYTNPITFNIKKAATLLHRRMAAFL